MVGFRGLVALTMAGLLVLASCSSESAIPSRSAGSVEDGVEAESSATKGGGDPGDVSSSSTQGTSSPAAQDPQADDSAGSGSSSVGSAGGATQSAQVSTPSGAVATLESVGPSEGAEPLSAGTSGGVDSSSSAGQPQSGSEPASSAAGSTQPGDNVPVLLVGLRATSNGLDVFTEQVNRSYLTERIVEIRAEPDVIAVAPDVTGEFLSRPPNDPSYRAFSATSLQQKYMQAMGVCCSAVKGVKEQLTQRGFADYKNTFLDGWTLPKDTSLAPIPIDEYPKSAPVRVALLDSGIQPVKPDLVGSIMGGYDFTTNVAEVPKNEVSDTDKESFHGTKVASVIAALRNNNAGVAGLSSVWEWEGSYDRTDDFFPVLGIQPWLVGDEVTRSRPTLRRVLQALGHMNEFKDDELPHIVLMPFALSGAELTAVKPGQQDLEVDPLQAARNTNLVAQTLAPLIDALTKRGVLFIASAEAGPDGSVLPPARLPGTLAVGGWNLASEKPIDSSPESERVDLVAPATRIAVQTKDPNIFLNRVVAEEGLEDGQSFAAAFVAGAVAIRMASSGPASGCTGKPTSEALWCVRQLRAAVIGTTSPLKLGAAQGAGRGLLNVAKLVASSSPSSQFDSMLAQLRVNTPSADVTWQRTEGPEPNQGVAPVVIRLGNPSWQGPLMNADQFATYYSADPENPRGPRWQVFVNGVPQPAKWIRLRWDAQVAGPDKVVLDGADDLSVPLSDRTTSVQTVLVQVAVSDPVRGLSLASSYKCGVDNGQGAPCAAF